MIDQFLALIAVHLGISKAATVAILGVIIAIANIIGKAIPDTATGFLGGVRKVCKVIGLYVHNKTAPEA